MEILSVALVTLATRLLAELKSRSIIPVFQIYLFALIFCILMRGYASSQHLFEAYLGFAVLIIKIAATIEMIKMLYRGTDAEDMLSIWVFAFGVAIIGWCVASGFREQSTLANPALVYIKHLAQVMLALIAISVVLFSLSYYVDYDCFSRWHACLMTALWWDYALVGIITPRSMSDWVLLNSTWTSIAQVLMIIWIVRIPFSTPQVKPLCE